MLALADRGVPDNKLWAEKYQIRDTMLPSFFPRALAEKVLLIGKAINFLRSCCSDFEWVQTFASSRHAAADLGYGDIKRLQGVVEKSSEVVNSRLVNILFEKYRLREHCRAVKSYILLAQGDFIQYLMHVVGVGINPIVTLGKQLLNMIGNLV
jgi:gamma-tubulin complex component 3